MGYTIAMDELGRTVYRHVALNGFRQSKVKYGYPMEKHPLKYCILGNRHLISISEKTNIELISFVRYFKIDGYCMRFQKLQNDHSCEISVISCDIL